MLALTLLVRGEIRMSINFTHASDFHLYYQMLCVLFKYHSQYMLAYVAFSLSIILSLSGGNKSKHFSRGRKIVVWLRVLYMWSFCVHSEKPKSKRRAGYVLPSNHMCIQARTRIQRVLRRRPMSLNTNSYQPPCHPPPPDRSTSFGFYIDGLSNVHRVSHTRFQNTLPKSNILHI